MLGTSGMSIANDDTMAVVVPVFTSLRQTGTGAAVEVEDAARHANVLARAELGTPANVGLVGRREQGDDLRLPSVLGSVDRGARRERER